MAAKKTELQKGIDSALGEIDKINPLATYLDKSSLSNVSDWIDTGSIVLNMIISGRVDGGIPKGRVTQIAGPSATAKSYFVQRILGNAQKKGYTPVIFDTENAIDAEGAERLGLDTSKVKYIPAMGIESTRNTIYKFLKNVSANPELHGKFIIAIDSIANLQSEMEVSRMEKDKTSADMGTFAKSIKSLLKTLTNMATTSQTPIIITNHVYDDPSAMYPSLEKHMAGGKAAVYLPSVTIQLAKKLAKDDEGKTIDDTKVAAQKSFSGSIIRALTVKNRFMQPYLEGEMYLSFATGLDKYYGVLTWMKDFGVIKSAGQTYVDFEGEKIGYYRNFRKDYDLIDNKLLPELVRRIHDKWGYGSGEGEEDIPDEDTPETLDDDIGDLDNLNQMVENMLEE
jgi:RecA/RadA recombinase